jgi:hypothetical protein
VPDRCIPNVGVRVRHRLSLSLSPFYTMKKALLNGILSVTVIYALLPSVASSQEQKSDWCYVAHTTDYNYYYDRASTKRLFPEREIFHVWIKEVARPKRRIKYAQTRVLYEVGCDVETILVIREVGYDKRGNMLHSETTKNGEAEKVIPDSIGDGILRKVCQELAH